MWDLVELVESTAMQSQMTREKFGEYYRKFFHDLTLLDGATVDCEA